MHQFNLNVAEKLYSVRPPGSILVAPGALWGDFICPFCRDSIAESEEAKTFRTDGFSEQKISG